MKTHKELKRKYISGIQQIGVGVKNFHEAWKWYIHNFGMNIRIFEEQAKAEYMLPHTNNEVWERHACLAMNMQGGGGFEIWQHTEHTPEAPVFELQMGDLGIFAGKIKSPDVHRAYEHLSAGANGDPARATSGANGDPARATSGANGDPARAAVTTTLLTEVMKDPAGRDSFYLKDPFDNIWQIVEEHSMFMTKYRKPTGGTFGAVIGTSDADRAKELYSDILDYDTVVYDKEGYFEDLEGVKGVPGVPGSKGKFRRVLLQHREKRKGPFARIFGPTEIELVQALDRKPSKIFKDRIWGDLGFIHLCFDVLGMKALKEECSQKGYPFTVDSDVHPTGKPFDMGEAAGHFSYIEDPDGTLIEFVESHKIPISKRMGWYLHLGKRKDVTRPLSDRIVKMLRFMKVNPTKLQG
jgi:catechol 2,3-dioxygenase-like lactoylglutathione lyase family enzyme